MRISDDRVRLAPSGGRGGVAPLRDEHRGEEPVGGVGKRCKPVANEAREGRARRLEQEQAVNSRIDGNSRARCLYRARARFTATAKERVRMRAAADVDSLEWLLGDPDGRALDLRVLFEKMRRKRRCEFLDRFERMFLGQSVCDVFHGVGRDDQAVVTVGIRRCKIAGQLDSDRELAHLVTIAQARAPS